jgi:hypothetical protein
VAAGSGQDLYGQSAQWLEKFKQNASREIGLNRNFRNAAPIAKFAHVFYEAALDINKIAKPLSKFDEKSDSKTVQTCYLIDQKANYLTCSTLMNHAVMILVFLFISKSLAMNTRE